MIDTKSYKHFKFKHPLTITNKKIYPYLPYHPKAPLPFKGFFKASVEAN